MAYYEGYLAGYENYLAGYENRLEGCEDRLVGYVDYPFSSSFCLVLYEDCLGEYEDYLVGYEAYLAVNGNFISCFGFHFLFIFQWEIFSYLYVFVKS